MSDEISVIPTGQIEQTILFIRGQKVMLDVDLARVYGVTAKRLREQLRRNLARFPGDFMFRLTKGETIEVSANCGDLSHLKFSPTQPNCHPCQLPSGARLCSFEGNSGDS